MGNAEGAAADFAEARRLAPAVDKEFEGYGLKAPPTKQAGTTG
jgi:hypothetical protein